MLADERARKRGELLDATEKKLTDIQNRVRRAKKPLRGKDKIALAIGAVIDRYKMAKHFAVTITDDDVTFARKTSEITAEAAPDGICVLRTSLKPETLDASSTVKTYKQLARVERAFRSIKTVDIEVRPIHHRCAHRVHAHVFLCMLAYCLEWRIRQALKSILFDDHDKAATEAARTSIVAGERPWPIVGHWNSVLAIERRRARSEACRHKPLDGHPRDSRPLRPLTRPRVSG
jgi:Transposase DDE domain